jgi:hypothetical protein
MRPSDTSPQPIETFTQTPVAFLIFNRPGCTAQVFAAIRAARPPVLLVVADGPRPDRLGEAERCAATRRIVDEGVDWPCTVQRNYSEANLGCRRRVSSGITWVFEQVEEAIILEDDCLPDPTFFPFCEQMLVRYREEERVWMISGCNFQPSGIRLESSYYFSHCIHIWGWATWRRAWQVHYDVAMATWPTSERGEWLRELLRDEEQAAVWKDIFNEAYHQQIDTWDFAWMYACMCAGGLSILPQVNLISNIGFRSDATHTSEYSPMANRRVHALGFPLVHPSSQEADFQADRRTFDFVFGRGSRNRRRFGKLVWMLSKPTRILDFMRTRLTR